MDTEKDIVCVEEIMAQIRQKIKDEGLTADMLSFEDIPLEEKGIVQFGEYCPEELKKSSGYICAHNQTDPYAPIEGSFIKRMVKRILRKLMQFYIIPLVSEQNAFNYHCSNSVGQLTNFAGRYEGFDPERLTARVEELELRNISHKKEIEELQNRIAQLEEQLRQANSSGSRKQGGRK
ncbi:MAG: hypothetical protein K2K57_07165 [Oscillospiraceae bacterium]|nr:hypothetical protein [Oscillospiraceae bacterium]